MRDREMDPADMMNIMERQFENEQVQDLELGQELMSKGKI
jgi:hypothetical protein